MLWSTRWVPVAPPVWEEGGERCSSAPARKKGLRGLLFLLTDSIYMGTSGPAVYYATQAGCEELWRGWRHEWSMLHHHGDSVPTVSVNRPPGSVRNHTLWCPVGQRWIPSCSSVLPSLKLSAGLKSFFYLNEGICNMHRTDVFIVCIVQPIQTIGIEQRKAENIYFWEAGLTFLVKHGRMVQTWCILMILVMLLIMWKCLLNVSLISNCLYTNRLN